MTAPPKMICRDLWKLFGPDAEGFLSAHPQATTEQFREHHLIPAVRAANLEIREGENFVIMGLSGSGKS
ncbi:MAG: glycine betaine/L-proline ABC transporter ATP-binding protein, partial [Rhodobiaceae bacterium]|nr:glycine betaine/L-proline ABC transporter ATP-binding protein [Rhodobiaceae bacterium]